MTTRRAANSNASVATDSAANSEASGSRRSSLNDEQPPQFAADDAQSHPGSQNAPNGTRETESIDLDDSKKTDSVFKSAEPDVPEAPSASSQSDPHDLESKPSRSPELTKSAKRKRASLLTEISEEPRINGVTNGTSNGEQSQSNPDAVSEATRDPELPPRKRQYRGRGRGRGGRQPRTISTHSSFAAQTDAASTPPSTTAPDRDAADHGSEDAQAESERPTKQPKRLPGRRRAPNSNPSIEADLRRQLQLKTAYRAVVKVLKPILAELADRSINDVEDDPTAHEESLHFDSVQADLDRTLADRVAYLDRKKHIEKTYAENRYSNDCDVVRSEFQNVFFSLQEDYFMRYQHRLLSIARAADLEAQEGYGSNDEDGLVPRRRGMQYKWRSTGFLDPRSDSRSRFFLETQKLWDNDQLRRKLTKERSEFLQANREEFDDEAAVNSREGFATYDPEQREQALAVFNAATLVQAAQAVEEPELIQTLEPIPNKEASGLMMLVDAIENFSNMPSAATELKPAISGRNTPVIEQVPPRATATPVSSRGRRKRGPSAKSTPRHRGAGSANSTPLPQGPDDALDATASTTSRAMSLDTELPGPSPRKPSQSASAEPMELDPALSESMDTEQPLPAIEEELPAFRPQMESAPRSEPPPRQQSVPNRITDILNKADDVGHSNTNSASSIATSSPAALPPVVLQPLNASTPLHESALSSGPGGRSQTATSRAETPLERPSDAAPTSETSASDLPTTNLPAGEPQKPTQKLSFWDALAMDNKRNTRPASPPNTHRTPLARVRQSWPQVLNTSSSARKSAEPRNGTFATADAGNADVNSERASQPSVERSLDGQERIIERITGSAERSIEEFPPRSDRAIDRLDMAPPIPRNSVSNEAGSRRSSGTGSVLSQGPPAGHPLNQRSPIEAPTKRSNSREMPAGLEQRQNRWRAAVPAQHGPNPPFRPNSNQPQNAFLKHQGWTTESQARHPAASATPPQQPQPPPFPGYATPYDPRLYPPMNYPPPPPGPYQAQQQPQTNPFLAAVPQPHGHILPPFPCPSERPPPYQSIYNMPPQGYGYPYPGYGPPPGQAGPLPPGAMPPGQVPPPPPGPFGQQYGGPPILPATTDRRHSAGPGQAPASGTPGPYPGSPPQATHPPAFQQQQQGQYGNGISGSERRGPGGGSHKKKYRHSTAGTEFRQYLPKGSGSGR
ncbi:uncharacterized protein J3D65DRAFT_669646 [Phyllosticta citribraziliensis]|uniref:Uncharacterized protein n=1 Tax=Phyllosticta citribraziliensis TaxID=989973 RepID=A0ABR1LJK0_9PEZI